MSFTSSVPLGRTFESKNGLIGDKNIDIETLLEEWDEYEIETGCKLKILGLNSSMNSPVIFYLGNEGERLWQGLQQTVNARFVYFPVIPSLKSSLVLYDLIVKAAGFVLDYANKSNVYFVGHGVGAFLAAKLLADQKLLIKSENDTQLQAAFLISGVYNSLELVSDLSHTKCTSWLPFGNMDLQVIVDEMKNFSPLSDDFNHLLKLGVRLYVFSAGDDEPQLKAQSRLMFDRLAESCDQDDLHFEIKERLNTDSLLVEMCKPNSFIGRLIRYDICVSQTR